MSDVFELVFMPWLAMRDVDEFRFRQWRVWNARLLDAKVPDAEIAAQVRAILGMYRARFSSKPDGFALNSIGIISLAPVVSGGLTEKAFPIQSIIRPSLFLSLIGQSLRFSGVNAGHEMFTAENFSVVRHTFERGNDRFSEISGTIVRKTDMGYRVPEVRYIMPPHINQPYRFRHDDRLKRGLEYLSRHNKPLFGRVARAASVLLESLYNSPDLDGRARILLQTLAFEILFDLPETGQRKELKNALEQLHAGEGDRRFRYKFQLASGRFGVETRTQYSLWADRFYTLRNRIIHGAQVRNSEYLFRGYDHFARAAPRVFVVSVARLIDQWLGTRGQAPMACTRLEWATLQEANEYDAEDRGFRITDDWAALWHKGQAAKPRRAP